jgi:hypothetical protein
MGTAYCVGDWNVYYEVHIKELAFLVCMPIWLSNSTGYTIQISVPPAFTSTPRLAFLKNDGHR